MKDEIKEILEEMKEICKVWVKVDGNIKSYNQDQINCIYDYITNLQEENKEWSMIFDTFSKRPLAHKYLEEKKKQLNNDNLLCLDSETIYKDYYDYKSRIDKAIEYLSENVDCYEDSYWKRTDLLETKELLNILKGEDE